MKPPSLLTFFTRVESDSAQQLAAGGHLSVYGFTQDTSQNVDTILIFLIIATEISSGHTPVAD